MSFDPKRARFRACRVESARRRKVADLFELVPRRALLLQKVNRSLVTARIGSWRCSSVAGHEHLFLLRFDSVEPLLKRHERDRELSTVPPQPACVPHHNCHTPLSPSIGVAFSGHSPESAHYRFTSVTYRGTNSARLLSVCPPCSR